MTDRTIRVVETRKLVDSRFTDEYEPDRIAPADLECAGSFARVVPYVPAEELERYKAVVDAVRKQLEWDHRIGTDELRDVMHAQGFIDETGARK